MEKKNLSIKLMVLVFAVFLLLGQYMLAQAVTAAVKGTKAKARVKIIVSSRTDAPGQNEVTRNTTVSEIMPTSARCTTAFPMRWR